ncbi:MAG: NERD domain-containing protein [Anaerolineales bacterium]
MKIIDKTPMLDEKGQLTLAGQIQGRLKYGLSWPLELEAQTQVVAQLMRVLDKGYVLIRNFTLPNSEIIIPIILLGPSGVTVIHVTTVKGHFEAKGDQWNVDTNGSIQPAKINLITRVSRFARAVQVFLERQKVELTTPVEAVLIAVDPGAHIESMRPVARVVMSDAIKQFATSILQARPIWRADFAYGLADRMLDPTPPEQQTPVIAPPLPQGPSRAQAIFNAEEAPLSDDLGFAFEEGEAPTLPPQPRNAQVARQGGPRPKQTPQKKKVMGMTSSQIALLAGLLFFELCILVAFGGYYFLFSQ